MKQSHRLVSRIVCLASLLGFVSPEFAAARQDTPASSEPAGTTRFIRVTGAEDHPAALETSVVRYSDGNRPGIFVDLVAAVHIGEADYYATLNELFKSYDVVLYELVAEAGTRIPRGGQRQTTNPIALLQTTARGFLGLESQLERIDYTRKNLRHADLSPADLAEKMRQRGDTGWSLALGAIADVWEQADSPKSLPDPSPAGMEHLLDLLSDPLRAKRFMARQFGDPAVLETGLGQTLNQLIVHDRNEAAVEVLDDELKQGSRKIAVFYGAAHMPDFEQRLASRGFQRSGQSWLAAWDLSQSSAPASEHPLSLLMQLLRELEQ